MGSVHTAACLALVSCCHTSNPTSQGFFCANKAAFSCTAPRCAAAEAVQMANNTQYGLAAYFFTQDLSRAWRVAERLEYGMVGVNEVAITSEVRLPGSRVGCRQAREVGRAGKQAGGGCWTGAGGADGVHAVVGRVSYHRQSMGS